VFQALMLDAFMLSQFVDGERGLKPGRIPPFRILNFITDFSKDGAMAEATDLMQRVWPWK